MNEKTKKMLIIVLVVILLVAVVALFFVLNNKSEDYILYNDKQEKAVKVSMPKDKGFEVKEDEGRTTIVEFVNEEGGYRIEVSLRDNLKSLYDTNLERYRDSDGFNEVKINKFEGYEHNLTSFSKEINLNLGEGKNGLYDIVNIYITRTADYDKGINDIVELKEVKSLFKSVKVVNYTAPEEVQNDPVNNDVNNDANDINDIIMP